MTEINWKVLPDSSTEFDGLIDGEVYFSVRLQFGGGVPGPKNADGQLMLRLLYWKKPQPLKMDGGDLFRAMEPRWGGGYSAEELIPSRPLLFRGWSDSVNVCFVDDIEAAKRRAAELLDGGELISRDDAAGWTEAKLEAERPVPKVRRVAGE